MSVLTAARIAPTILVLATLQVSAFSGIGLFGGTPDVLLVALVSVALLRGAVAGAMAGFFAGLIIDAATLGTLGITSLLLTLVGFWAGRYAETTGRGRALAPLVAVLVATVLLAVFGYGLQAMLGEPVSATTLLLALPATVVLNGVLAFPVFRLTRSLVGLDDGAPRAREVELLV